jgi:hypothetical protein
MNSVTARSIRNHRLLSEARETAAIGEIPTTPTAVGIQAGTNRIRSGSATSRNNTAIIASTMGQRGSAGIALLRSLVMAPLLATFVGLGVQPLDTAP